jgi:ABC-2 type transport system permease protein
MSLIHLIGMIRKEFIQIRRDRRLFPIIVIAPVIQLFLFGYAVSLDIKDIPTVVMDERNDNYSREVLLSLTSSDYFIIEKVVNNLNEMEKLIEDGFAEAGLVIRDREGLVIFIDGSDNNTATLIEGYFEEALSKYNLNRPRVIPVPRILFNPDLKSVNFMVPGITGLVILIITMVLASGILVREREIGTLEHILVTPVSKMEVIAGKLFPFLLIGYLELFLVVSAGILIFDTPFKGNFGFLALATFPYILTSISMGLFVSTISKTQQQAVITAFMIMLPNILLSGFMFPIENMPLLLQKLTFIIPVRYFMTILRSVFLKGAGLEVLWREILALFGFGFAFFLFSISTFRKTLL